MIPIFHNFTAFNDFLRQIQNVECKKVDYSWQYTFFLFHSFEQLIFFKPSCLKMFISCCCIVHVFNMCNAKYTQLTYYKQFKLKMFLLQITGFKEFFISMNFPYSVIRGEEVSLQVDVFNYKSDGMAVSI